LYAYADFSSQAVPWFRAVFKFQLASANHHSIIKPSLGTEFAVWIPPPQKLSLRPFLGRQRPERSMLTIHGDTRQTDNMDNSVN
jgi:hypothetical protein